MKKFAFVSFIVLAALMACNKNDVVRNESVPDSSNEIVFDVEDLMSTDIDTKSVTVVNSSNLSSFYVAATTGSAGSEELAWGSTEFTQGSGGYVGGKYWPSSNPGYHFYCSNIPVTFNANGCTVAAANDTDVVCDYISSSGYKASNIVTLRHIFSRLGDVTVSAKDTYTLENVSITITPNTGGTYNLRTGYSRFDGTGWSSLTAGSSTELTNGTVGTKSNDIYLVPGNYTLTATWTAKLGNYSQTYTNKTTSIDVAAGKVTSLNISLGGAASEIKLTVSVSEWGSETLNPTFPM